MAERMAGFTWREVGVTIEGGELVMPFGRPGNFEVCYEPFNKRFRYGSSKNGPGSTIAERYGGGVGKRKIEKANSG